MAEGSTKLESNSKYSQNKQNVREEHDSHSVETCLLSCNKRMGQQDSNIDLNHVCNNRATEGSTKIGNQF